MSEPLKAHDEHFSEVDLKKADFNIRGFGFPFSWDETIVVLQGRISNSHET